MAGLKVEIVGMAALKKKWAQKPELVRAALGLGLYQLGAAIASDSVRLAPKKYGVLRASVYCTLPKEEGGSTHVTVGYGGYAKAYAWVQHERMDFKHTEGGPKYLERAVQAYQGRASDIVLKVVQQALESGRAAKVAAVLNSDPNQGPPPPSGGRKK